MLFAYTTTGGTVSDKYLRHGGSEYETGRQGSGALSKTTFLTAIEIRNVRTERSTAQWAIPLFNHTPLQMTIISFMLPRDKG